MPSFESAGPMIEFPPETRNIIGVFKDASTQFLKTPLVSIKASVNGRSGAIVLRGSSSFERGPKKYPWSTASHTARPVSGFINFDILFFIPQSMFSPPPKLCFHLIQLVPNLLRHAGAELFKELFDIRGLRPPFLVIDLE